MAFVVSTGACVRRHRTVRMLADREPQGVDGKGRREFLLATASLMAGLVVGRTDSALAKPEGVNRPELLPSGYTTVVDLEKFLTSGERSRLEDQINQLEEKTGVKLRVLTQRYPQTPGLAVKEYWDLDDKSILMVADFFGGTGNLLKFNVGEEVYAKLPPRFWSLLSAKFGSQFYVKKYGEDGAILDALYTIRGCLIQGGCQSLP